MKNKKNVYLLLTITIIVWGLIGFKVYQKLFPVSSSDEFTFEQAHQRSADSIFNRAYTLNLNYPDPFLRSLMKVTKPSNTYSERKTILSQKEPDWPNIVYYGYVNKSDKPQASLQIDQNFVLVKENQKINEWNIVQITQDSIMIEFQKKYKKYGRQ